MFVFCFCIKRKITICIVSNALSEQMLNYTANNYLPQQLDAFAEGLQVLLCNF